MKYFKKLREICLQKEMVMEASYNPTDLPHPWEIKVYPERDNDRYYFASDTDLEAAASRILWEMERDE